MKEMTIDEVKQIMQEAGVSLLDVREDFEVNLGKIPGALHIPLGDIPERYQELDRDKKHIIICRSGGRSEMATQFLLEKGYDAYNMLGGMMDWDGEIE